MASHINRRYKAVPTKVGATTVRLDSAYGSAPIQEFVKEKVANGYIYSVRFNVAWEIFGATIDVSSRIDKDQSALDKINIIVNCSDEHDVFLPLFDRLAMLIDPVTNVVIETNEDDDVEYIFCGGCGEEFSTDLFNEHEITHCPYCGCRFRNPRQN